MGATILFIVIIYERVKTHFLSYALMISNNGSDKSNNNRAFKAKAAMPITWILAATALMSGLLLLTW